VFIYGFGGTTMAFTKIGVPIPPASAAYASIVELLGGGLLILGAATTIVSALVVLDMIGASLTTRSFLNGVFVQQHGFELEASICVGALLLPDRRSRSVQHRPSAAEASPSRLNQAPTDRVPQGSPVGSPRVAGLLRRLPTAAAIRSTISARTAVLVRRPM
jgi:hypothetical protein